MKSMKIWTYDRDELRDDEVDDEEEFDDDDELEREDSRLGFGRDDASEGFDRTGLRRRPPSKWKSTVKNKFFFVLELFYFDHDHRFFVDNHDHDLKA